MEGAGSDEGAIWLILTVLLCLEARAGTSISQKETLGQSASGRAVSRWSTTFVSSRWTPGTLPSPPVHDQRPQTIQALQSATAKALFR